MSKGNRIRRESMTKMSFHLQNYENDDNTVFYADADFYDDADAYDDTDFCDDTDFYDEDFHFEDEDYDDDEEEEDDEEFLNDAEFPRFQKKAGRRRNIPKSPLDEIWDN